MAFDLGSILGGMGPIDLQQPQPGPQIGQLGTVAQAPMPGLGGAPLPEDMQTQALSKWQKFQQSLKERPELADAIMALGASMMQPGNGAENFGKGITGAMQMLAEGRKRREEKAVQQQKLALDERQVATGERAQAASERNAADRAAVEKQQLELQTKKLEWDINWDTKKWADQLGMDARRLKIMERQAGSEEAINALRLQILGEDLKTKVAENGSFKVDGTPAQMAMAATANSLMQASNGAMNKDQAMVAALDRMPEILPKIAKATGADKDERLRIATTLYGQLSMSQQGMKMTPQDLWDTALDMAKSGKVDLLAHPAKPGAATDTSGGASSAKQLLQAKYPAGQDTTIDGRKVKVLSHQPSGVEVEFNGKKALVPWSKLIDLEE